MNLGPTRRVRPLEAARSLRALLQNPDDTGEVFRLLDAVSSGLPPRFAARFASSRNGQSVLAEKPDLFAALRDRERLALLPDGSLGRAYLDFMVRGGLTPEWLVAASEAKPDRLEEATDAYLGRRLRDMHDLWHVVTGYQGDLLGEASVLAFTLAQTASPGIGLLVSAGYLLAGDPDGRRLITDAFVRGMRSAWLPAAPWEKLLARPLDEVRDVLRVGPPPSYEPFFAKDLPPGGLLAKSS